MRHAIAHPPLPDPAAYMLADDLATFSTRETYANVFSVSVSTPDDRSVPLFTAQQMREYRDAPAWLPIATAPKDGLVDIMSDGRRYAGCHWDAICSEFRHITVCGVLVRLRKASHWAPIPAAPIEQATGEKL